MKFSFDAIKSWLAGLFSSKNRAAIVSVVEHASVFIDHAMPIVEAIDKELKPALNDKNKPVMVVIEQFIIGGIDSEHATDARKEAQRIAYLPTADMLVNVALFMLIKSKPGSVPTRILRLAIEMAYNIYKVMKSEAEVSGSD